jgi:hypothetical protein
MVDRVPTRSVPARALNFVASKLLSVRLDGRHFGDLVAQALLNLSRRSRARRPAILTLRRKQIHDLVDLDAGSSSRKGAAMPLLPAAFALLAFAGLSLRTSAGRIARRRLV